MRVDKSTSGKSRTKNGQELLEAVFKHAPDAYYINDLLGRFVDGNVAAEKLTGYSKQELLGKDFLRCGLLPANQIPRAVMLHAENIKGKATIQEPLVLKRKNGDLVPVEISTYPIKINKKTLVLGIARDVSERQKSIERLKESEFKYRQLFENMTSACAYHRIIADGNGNPVDYEFLDVNLAFEKMLNLNAAGIKGKKVTEIFKGIKEEKFDWVGTYGRVALAGEAVKFEAPYGRGSAKKWYSVSAYCPQKGYFVAVFDEITERKVLEDALFQALESSQKREREIAEMLSGARYALSGANLKETALVLMNSLKKLTGAANACFILERVSGTILISDKGEIKDECQAWPPIKKKMLNSEGMAEPFLVKTPEELGENLEKKVSFNYMMALPIIGEGEIKGAMLIYNKPEGFSEEEITAVYRMAEISSISVYNREVEEGLKESYAKLKELDVLKNNFMSMVSHELRTPFTAIKGFLKVLKQGAAGSLNEKQHEYIDIVMNNSDRLLNLINDLLDMAKVESGVFVVKKESNDFSALIRETFTGINSIAREKSIQLILQAEPDPFVFDFDKYRLSQVIINLLNNAIKISPNDTVITVSAGITGEFMPPDYVERKKVNAEKNIIIKVKDMGPGINAEECRKIFDKFYQVLEKGHMGHKGTGLGLSITKGIVEAHGGIIWAESEGPGKGATFVIILPVE